MLTHETILDTLRDAFDPKYGGDKGIALIARYDNPALKLSGRRAQIFLPDCHLLSRRDAPAYPKWGFKQEEDLALCLARLTTLKADSPGQLRVWHLGDIFDIWRARGGIGDAAEVDLISADFPEIVDRVRDGPPHGLKAEIIAGNHDYALFRLSEWEAARYKIVPSDDPEGGDILVLHGDLFDWIERLPDGIQAAAVRLATGHASGRQNAFNDPEAVMVANRLLELGDHPIGTGEAELSQGNGAVPAETAVNVVAGDQGNEKAPNKRFYAAGKALVQELRGRGHNIRALIVGHTHWPRIVAGDAAGQPFVLMDCGSWLGMSRLEPGGPWVHSAQIGVLVENDLRLYQLGSRSA